MSWLEAEKVLCRDTVVLIPLGGQLKEHGSHLPLNNDWVIANKLTEMIMEKLPVIVLPTVNHNFYPAMVDYPGTVSLQESTAKALISDIVNSIAKFGPRYFYVLNTGISTIRPLNKAREELEKDDIHLSFTDLRTALEPTKSEIEEQEGGTHADEIETSMMLSLAPHIVNIGLAEKDYHGNTKGPLRRNREKPGLYSPTGSWGDPTLASKEKGDKLVNCLINSIEKDIKDIFSKIS